MTNKERRELIREGRVKYGLSESMATYIVDNIVEYAPDPRIVTKEWVAVRARKDFGSELEG